ncbi:MAG: DUF3105 domain-containing protein [bacterium]|nr:DUF3105 domain-containing protein [bacterium]
MSKQERYENQERKRLINKITMWTIVVLVIGGLGYGLYYLASQPEKPKPGEAFPILGQEHIEVGATHPAYNSNPPTSGWHYAKPADWGVYQEELPDEQLIHNLEHGGIWIAYKDVDQKTKSDLEVIGKKYPGSVIVTPRSGNDAKIVLASWGRLETLESFNETRIVDFIKANRNKSPEPLAR